MSLWLRAQGCDGPEIENALVERKRLADTPLVAGRSRAQHRQPGVAQPIRGQVLGPPVIFDHGNDRDFLQGALLGELRRLPLRRDCQRKERDENKRLRQAAFSEREPAKVLTTIDPLLVVGAELTRGKSNAEMDFASKQPFRFNSVFSAVIRVFDRRRGLRPVS